MLLPRFSTMLELVQTMPASVAWQRSTRGVSPRSLSPRSQLGLATPSHPMRTARFPTRIDVPPHLGPAWAILSDHAWWTGRRALERCCGSTSHAAWDYGLACGPVGLLAGSA